MTYNEIIQQVGKTIIVDVYYNNGTTTHVNEDNIGKTKIYFKSDLLGTAINGCELTLKEQIEGTIYIDIQASFGEYTQTKTYGPYYIKEEKFNADELTYEYTLYDNLIISMIDYEALEVTYPITNYNFFKALTTKLGYTNNIASLPNGTIQMTTDIYNNIGYTFRDVLDDIAVANGVCFYIDGNEIKIVQRGTNTIEIDDDILKNQNIAFGEHYGPINAIVLSRSADSDTVNQRDEQSITQNGLCELKISDNQILNDNNRSDYLPAIANELFGIEYDIYDTELVGYGDIKIQDEVEFETGENTYTSYVFNNEITITSGFKQVIYNKTPNESETDYKTSSTSDKMIKQAYIIVDKQQGQINSFVGRVNTLEDNYDNLDGEVNELGTRMTQTENNVSIAISTANNVQDTINNGVPKVVTTLVKIDNNGIDVGKSDSKVHTTMTNNEFKVGNEDTKLAFIGYDEDEQVSKAEMDNLRVNKWLNAGAHRIEKFEINLQTRTGHFYDE